MNNDLFMQYMLIILITDVLMNFSVFYYVRKLNLRHGFAMDHMVKTNKLLNVVNKQMTRNLSKVVQAIQLGAEAQLHSMAGLLNKKLGAEQKTIEKHLGVVDQSTSKLLNLVKTIQNFNNPPDNIP